MNKQKFIQFIQRLETKLLLMRFEEEFQKKEKLKNENKASKKVFINPFKYDISH